MKPQSLTRLLQLACTSTILCSAFSATPPAQALTLYDDRTEFLSDTNATEVSLEPRGVEVDSFTLDNLTFTIARPTPETLNLANNWTDRLPGIDLAVNGVESFDVDIANAINYFGFDFVEPEFDPLVNSPVFIDSTFEVTLLKSGGIIDSFEFTRPNDVASFVGFSSDQSFDRVEIRETVGAAENEFFGSFYVGTATNSESTPEPGLALGYGILGLGAFWKSQFRQRS